VAKSEIWAKEGMGSTMYEPCSDSNVCAVIVPIIKGDVVIVNIYDEPGTPALYSTRPGRIE